MIAPGGVDPSSLAPPDRDRLVAIFAAQARTTPDGSDVFFEELIAKANLPPTWSEAHAKTVRYNPSTAARRLIDWALVKKENPQAPGFTTLGSLLHALLPDLGYTDARYIVAVVSHYHLYRDQRLLHDLNQRYLVPRLAEDLNETVNFGPEITWRGLGDERVALEGWFSTPPPLLDVGFLHRALQQAAAICRIELANDHRRGTGFLVAPRLVLTCFHVLKHEPRESLEENARNARIRFGCFTARDGDELSGQVFALDANPVVKASPSAELDYVLLRVADSISRANGLSPVTFATSAPAVNHALNILQHPEGNAMQLAFCCNGVTALDESRGRIQYVTRTKSGSSGAPCFDDEWRVVAVHHAQRAQAWGSVREGILFGPIYEEIRASLS